MRNDIISIPVISIHPDRICSYFENHRPTAEQLKEFSVVKKIDTQLSMFEVEKTDINTLIAPDHELPEIADSFLHSARKAKGIVSIQAKRKIFKAIDYLIVTSSEKKVYERISGKMVKFRLAFITLTLPSKQIHTDGEIIHKCLNQFIIETKYKYLVEKYVWRAELQRNGNIHFHVLIDKFIPYYELRNIWNRIIEKLGYITRYRENMKKYYESGFTMSKSSKDKRTKDQQYKSYLEGRKHDYSNPNSTDIHSTRKVRDLKKYLSKYLTKQPESKESEIVSDAETRIQGGRIWSCSQNLSNIKGCQMIVDSEISAEVNKVIKASNCRFFQDTYFAVYYIDFQSLPAFGSDLLFKYFSDYLIERFDFHVDLKIAI